MRSENQREKGKSRSRCRRRGEPSRGLCPALPATGAVATGLSLVASFWVPPFASRVKTPAGEQTLAAEMTTLEAVTEPARTDD